VSDASEELDVLIDDYLDGRMDLDQRVQFEERMSRDPQLRHKVLSATQSVNMVQQALGWVTPSEDFDSKVSNKITSISQSGFNFKPAGAKAPDKELTAKDVDAKLLADPDAARENKRLLIIGVVAVVIFAIAAAAVMVSIGKKTDAPPPAPTAPAK